MKITKAKFKQIIKEEMENILKERPTMSGAKYQLQDPHRGKKGTGMVDPKWDNKTKVAYKRLRAAQKEMAMLLKKAMDDAAMRPTSSIEAIWYAHDSMDQQQGIIMDIIAGITGEYNNPGKRGGGARGTYAGRQAAKKLKTAYPDTQQDAAKLRRQGEK